MIQKDLLEYMRKEFSFAHLGNAKLGDPMHFHSYALVASDSTYRLELSERLSTDVAGVATVLNRGGSGQATELDKFLNSLSNRITDDTRLSIP